MALFQVMVGSPRQMASELPSIQAADDRLDQVETTVLQSEDANDVIWWFDASRDYDPAPGLHAIQAPLLAVNFEDDLLNPAELGGLERAIVEVPHGRAIMLPAGPHSRGHQTLHLAATWCHHLAELLGETVSA